MTILIKKYKGNIILKSSFPRLLIKIIISLLEFSSSYTFHQVDASYFPRAFLKKSSLLARMGVIIEMFLKPARQSK